MIIGPIEAVRVFTTKLAEARRFYADTLGLPETFADDAIAMFDTGQAKHIAANRTNRLTHSPRTISIVPLWRNDPVQATMTFRAFDKSHRP